MRSTQECTSFPNLAVYDGSITTINGEFLRISCHNLHTTILESFSISKNATSIVINPQSLRHGATTRKSLPHNLQSSGPSTSFGLILKAVKSKPSASPREKSQFSITDDFHPFLADFPFTSSGPVVASSTETEVLSAHLHVLLDASVALAIQHFGIPHVSSTRHDQKSAGSHPRFLENLVAADCDDGIVGPQ